MAEEKSTESKPTRPESRDQRPRGRPGGGGRRFFRRKKVDYFSVNKIDDINYKDVDVLKQFIGDRGKILPRRHTGLGAMHQRKLKIAIKRARNIALLPFAGGSDSLRSPRVESKSAEAKTGGVTKAAETKADKPTSAESKAAETKADKPTSAESKAVETKADKPTSAETNPAAKSQDG